MPLGTEHVQAAELAHLLALGLALGVEPREQLLVAGLELGRADGETFLQALAPGQALGVAAEEDVDAAAGHVGGDRDRAELAGLHDDLGFPLVLLGVQHLVRDALLLQLARQLLRLLDRDRADQHGLALLVALGDVFDRGRELRVLGLVDVVGVVDADHRPVRRDRHDLQVVGVRELARLGRRGAGHAAELLVHAEVVLQRDGREGLVLLFDLHALFGLDGLVQTFAPTPALEDATGELVDDLHLAGLDDVVDVALEQLLGPQRLLELVHVVLVHVLVEVLDAERLLDPRDALLGGDDGALGLVDLVVAVALQTLRRARTGSRARPRRRRGPR